MTFTYPAVFTPHKEDDGYHAVFPDLECCEADGRDLEETIEQAKDAAYDWLMLELEDGGNFPEQTHVEDIKLEDGELVKRLLIRIKLMPDND